MSPLTFSWEPLAALLDDGLYHLIIQHWQEIALDQTDVPLDVDWDEYQRQEDLGQWRAFVARRGPEIRGYVAWFLYHPARYRSTLYACDDVFWLHPDERHGLTGYQMLKRALADLPRPCKVQMKIKLSFQDGRVAKLMARLGLSPIETVYSGFLR